MDNDLNIVQTTVKIAGNECLFVDLSLSQGFNTHHTFQLKVNYEELDQSWMNDPGSIVDLVGEAVVIEMVNSQESSASYSFTGIITNVTIAAKSGNSNNVVIHGKGETIRMDGKKSVNSFIDSTLDNVVKDIMDNSASGVSADVSCTYSSTIDYLCQYNETDFEFLNRLSWIYGEWFYYTGSDIKFGKGDQSSDDPVELTYDVDLREFQMSANLVPALLNRYNYLVHDDTDIISSSPDSVTGVRGHLQTAMSKSDSVYAYGGTMQVEAPVLSKEELDNMVEVERSRDVGQMLVMRGAAKTCAVQLGKTVKVLMPESLNLSSNEVDTFLITTINHHVDEKGYYTNDFSGIISDIKNIPMTPVRQQFCNPQQAVVLDNADADSKGRVKVQLLWQKTNDKSTNWIRVQTPDAGTSEKFPANRGFVFIPEIGDVVMVGFESGDPNRPYVMGSMFTENTGAGGSDNNKLRTLTTKNGCAVTLNDDDGSITIKDPENSTIMMDGSGVLVLDSSTTIQLSCGDSSIVLQKDGTIEINGKSIAVNGSEEVGISGTNTASLVSNTESVTLDGQGSTTSVSGTSVEVNAGADMTVTGTQKTDVTSTGMVSLSGMAVKLN